MNKSISVVSSNSNPNNSNTNEKSNLKLVSTSIPGQDALFDLDEFSRHEDFKTQKEIALEEGRKIWAEKMRIQRNKEKVYFSLDQNGELLYYNQPLDDRVVSWVKDISNKHNTQNLNRTSVLEAFIYAAISGATSLEDNSMQFKIIKNYFNGDYPEDEIEIWDFFADLGNINGNSKKPAIETNYDSKKNPFVTFGNFVKGMGGYELAGREFLSHPFEFRKDMVKAVHGVSFKVSSFFYLMMGGHDLMTLDSKNCRQMTGLGNNMFNIKERNAFTFINSNGNKRKPEPPTPKQYLRIEEEVMDYFSGLDCFKYNNTISGNYLTCLFWGADIRGRKLGQNKTRTADMFEEGSSSHNIMPKFD